MTAAPQLILDPRESASTGGRCSVSAQTSPGKEDPDPDQTAITAQLDLLDQHSATLLPYLSGAQIPRTPRERATLDHALRALCQKTPQLITALRHAFLHLPASTLEQIEDLLTP